MYSIIQPNILGGICHASVRYAENNNKLIGSLYDPQQFISYIIKLNSKNLWGWAMSQEMPEGDFEWLSNNEGRNMGLLLNYTDGRRAIFDT